MSKVTRRGALLGSIVASITSLFGRRAKAGSEDKVSSEDASSLAARQKAFVTVPPRNRSPDARPLTIDGTPYWFMTPVPSNKEIEEASAGERMQLAHDLALEAAWIAHVYGTPAKNIRAAARRLPIFDMFDGYRDILMRHHTVVSAEQQQFVRTWADPTGARNISGSKMMWNMTCRYMCYVLQTKESAVMSLTQLRSSGPMVVIHGCEPAREVAYRYVMHSFFASWPSQLKKAEERIKALTLPERETSGLIRKLTHWTRGWRPIHEELASPGYAIHCMICDSAKQFIITNVKEPTVICVTPDMAYHLWQWQRRERYCAPTLTLDDWKKKTSCLVGMKAVFDSPDFKLA